MEIKQTKTKQPLKTKKDYRLNQLIQAKQHIERYRQKTEIKQTKTKQPLKAHKQIECIMDNSEPTPITVKNMTAVKTNLTAVKPNLTAVKSIARPADDIWMQESGNMDSSNICLLYTSPSPRDRQKSRMPSSA